jgi:hypothetical protein
VDTKPITIKSIILKNREKHCEKIAKWWDMYCKTMWMWVVGSTNFNGD